jgi:CRISPR-associated protein Cas6
MSDAVQEMVDAIFDVSGEALPANYRFALWQTLIRHLPELAADDSIGVLPIRTSSSAAGMLIPKRAKLTVRIPQHLAQQIQRLAGQALHADTVALTLGNGKLRPLQPYPTLHAHFVTGDTDEPTFMAAVSSRLDALGIAGKLICGMRHRLDAPDQPLHGYSLVIHDLKPEASLRLQYAGLGSHRKYGCGIFVPYKAISDLD